MLATNNREASTPRVTSPAIDFSGSHEPELSAAMHHLRMAEHVLMAMDLRIAAERALRSEMLTRLATTCKSVEELKRLRGLRS